MTLDQSAITLAMQGEGVVLARVLLARLKATKVRKVLIECSRLCLLSLAPDLESAAVDHVAHFVHSTDMWFRRSDDGMGFPRRLRRDQHLYQFVAQSGCCED
jgi:hypothetical protein